MSEHLIDSQAETLTKVDDFDQAVPWGATFREQGYTIMARKMSEVYSLLLDSLGLKPEEVDCEPVPIHLHERRLWDRFKLPEGLAVAELQDKLEPVVTKIASPDPDSVKSSIGYQILTLARDEEEKFLVLKIYPLGVLNKLRQAEKQASKNAEKIEESGNTTVEQKEISTLDTRVLI